PGDFAFFLLRAVHELLLLEFQLLYPVLGDLEALRLLDTTEQFGIDRLFAFRQVQRVFPGKLDRLFMSKHGIAYFAPLGLDCRLQLLLPQLLHPAEGCELPDHRTSASSCCTVLRKSIRSSVPCCKKALMA